MDSAGNTLANARKIRLSASPQSFQDSVNSKDTNDYYQVQLKNKSQLSLKLSNLKANADLELLSSEGSLIKRSSNSRTQSESIKTRLDTGTYYLRVYPKRGADTTYNFNGTTIGPSTFDIQFDYRFDSANWFTPERRAVLEQAGQIWENIILDEFANVPTGTEVYVSNPSTGNGQYLNIDYAIDDLVVFVGTRPSLGALGLGGPTGTWTVGSSLDKRFNGSDFEPWVGNISFNPDANWFFDSSPNTADDIPNNANDFLSVAVHELGHVLGIGTSDAFDNLISNGRFTGRSAKSLNGGNPIPLDGSGGHIKENFVLNSKAGETLMDPSLLVGSRKLPSKLDIALLNDIGYPVNYAKAVINDSPRTFSLARTQSVQAACGCAACLMASRSNQRSQKVKTGGDRTTTVLQPLQTQTVQQSILDQVLKITNRQRQRAGLEPLTLSSSLTTVAQKHSADMAKNDFMGSTGSNGSDLGDRLRDRDYRWNWANENVAAGYATPREVMDVWLDSRLHRANVLSNQATEIGIGYKYLKNDSGSFNYNYYWTLVFASPQA